MRIVRFKGGLGNQMFQYAFLKALENDGNEVGASLGFYDDFPNTRRFELIDVFSRINLDCNPVYDKIFSEAYKSFKGKTRGSETKIESAYKVWSETAEQEGNYQKEVYVADQIVFVGYWQTYKYFESIKEKIRADFSFRDKAELKKKIIHKLGITENCVSVHVRRGDYLKLNEMYGGICTDNYYIAAINYVRQKIKNPRFIFLSDDIEWVKNQKWVSDGVYVEEKMFDNYRNWYDMLIMSMCSHNIIANSTFSWWGAWLNENDKKMIIAPKRWNNMREYRDIYPESWITI